MFLIVHKYIGNMQYLFTVYQLYLHVNLVPYMQLPTRPFKMQMNFLISFISYIAYLYM